MVNINIIKENNLFVEEQIIYIEHCVAGKLKKQYLYYGFYNSNLSKLSKKLNYEYSLILHIFIIILKLVLSWPLKALLYHNCA